MYTCIYWKGVGLSLRDFWDANIKAWKNMNCILMKACHVEMNIDSSGCSAHSWWFGICRNGEYNPPNKTERTQMGFQDFCAVGKGRFFLLQMPPATFFVDDFPTILGGQNPKHVLFSWVLWKVIIFQENGGCKSFFVFEEDFWNLSKMILILLVGETYLNHLFGQIFLGRPFFFLVGV